MSSTLSKFEPPPASRRAKAIASFFHFPWNISHLGWRLNCTLPGNIRINPSRQALIFVDTLLPGRLGHSTAEPDCSPILSSQPLCSKQSIPSYGCWMQDYALADSSYHHIATLLLTLVAGSMGKGLYTEYCSIT